MTNKKTVHFKANAGVKDIVGRGLIYSDNIAIIELVKNSKDANSLKSTIRFENEIEISKNSTLIISDNGDGMTFEDIKNKWLNIAYSEKKEKKFAANKTIYAGNKGVGRFSCDRLGKKLILYTKSKEGDYLKLPIDWEIFEERQQDDEINMIPLDCYILDKKTFLNEVGDSTFNHGTILKIKELRSEWSSKKLKKLISELEKFLSAPDINFEVFLYSDSEHDDEVRKKINGKIDNNILKKLSFKTTNIRSHIDSSGKNLVTSLLYQGEELYVYHAVNPYKHLKNINIEIHFLDVIAKSYFTKTMGMSSLDYGSIFLFHNGFRISPYGNPKNDWLNLDQRKSQGTARFLGTREVLGRIDITDTDNVFSIVSSREGLAHDEAFFDLVAFDSKEKTRLQSGKEDYGYVTTIMRQLEHFVVTGLDWNNLVDRLSTESTRVLSGADALKSPNRYKLKEISPQSVKEACDKILKSNFEIKSFKINDDLILRIADVTEEKYQQFIRDFLEDVEDKDIKNLSSKEKVSLKKIIQNEQEKTRSAKEERDYAEKKRSEAEEGEKKAATLVEAEKRRSNFLESLTSPEKTLDALITHVMKQISGGIEKDVRSILTKYYKNPEKVTKDELVSVLEDVVIDVETIKESTTMATKANFDLKISSIKEDIFGFFEDYIKEIASKERKWGVNIHFSNPSKLQKILTFKPAEMCVLFVNILDNARKAGAKNLHVLCENNQISFSDDGRGFDLNTYKVDDLFRKGISTTGGSGLGLYHCKRIVEHVNAVINITNNKVGAAIKIIFP